MTAIPKCPHCPPTFSYRSASPKALGARWDVLTEEVSIWKVEYALSKMLAEALAEADAEAQQRITALEAENTRLVDWLGRTQVERDDARNKFGQEVVGTEHLRKQLAALTAEAREAGWSALTKLMAKMRENGLPWLVDGVARFRDLEYPAPTPAKGVTIKRDAESVATVLWHDNQYRVESSTGSWVASTLSCASAIYTVNNLMRPNQPFVQDDEMRLLLALAATGGG